MKRKINFNKTPLFEERGTAFPLSAHFNKLSNVLRVYLNKKCSSGGGEFFDTNSLFLFTYLKNG